VLGGLVSLLSEAIQRGGLRVSHEVEDETGVARQENSRGQTLN